MAPPDRERSGARVTGAATSAPGPLRVRGEVLAVGRAGAFRVLSLAAPGVPAAFRPGTFVVASPGDDRLAARAWWIHRVDPASAFGPTIEVVVDPGSPSGAWFADLAVGTRIALTGPLGRPFTLPRQPVAALLVGEGHAVAPLLALAERLRARECPVTLLVGARDEKHLLAVREARRLVRQVVVVTEDGSVGHRGVVADHVGSLLASSSAGVLYTAGRPDAVRAVASIAASSDVPSQVALEVPMPCGTGLCHGCVVAVVGDDAVPRQVRACTEGPVLPGHRIDWEALP